MVSIHSMFALIDLDTNIIIITFSASLSLVLSLPSAPLQEAVLAAAPVVALTPGFLQLKVSNNPHFPNKRLK